MPVGKCRLAAVLMSFASPCCTAVPFGPWDQSEASARKGVVVYASELPSPAPGCRRHDRPSTTVPSILRT